MKHFALVVCFVVVSSFTLIASGIARAAGVTKAVLPHLQVELVTVPPEAGPHLQLGIRFLIEPGWHIYGSNPGDVGLPTTINWHLPLGLSAGDVLYPPAKDFHTDGLLSHGYENEVLFTSDLQDRSKGSVGEKVEVAADVSWVLCKEECIPGQASLSQEVTLNKVFSNSLGSHTTENRSLLVTLGAAFAGGLLLNLMPCVFPVLSLKVLSFVEQKEARTSFIHGALFASGIILSFWLLAGLLFAVRAFGSKVGWGFQFQSPMFVAGMGLVIFTVALNFLGVFEIGFGAQRLAGNADRGTGYLGSFFSGVLSTLLATPCSAPFMAAAISAALAMNSVLAFVVFTVLGLGMSLPYVILSLFPRLLRFLPRPGPWMIRLKQFLAFPLFATVIWLLWILSFQIGTPELINFIVGTLLLGLGLWIFGTWGSPQSEVRTRRIATYGCLVLLVAAIYVGVPFDSSSVSVAAVTKDAEKASSSLPAEPFSLARLHQLIDAREPVLVEFTAAWCVTCQVNHHVLFDSPEVSAAVRSHGVAVLIGDWTKNDPEITDALNTFGRSGVPLTALYLPESESPIILPQVLTAGAITDALREVPDVNSGVPIKKACTSPLAEC